VNLLRLDAEREELRDTIFYSLFSSSILFDSLPDATAYRKHCIERNQPCAVLYTRTGEKLDAHGLLDPRDRPSERSLEYVFGEQPVQHTREFAAEVQQTAIGEATESA
jgi:hypothetical protein